MEKQIIYFDGVCGLCNGFVDFIVSVDKKSSFYFSPLQSEYAQKNLTPEMVKNLDSIVVQMNGKTLQKSEAVIEVLGSLGGLWKLILIARLFSTPFNDYMYDHVARNRYKIMGKKETCRLPTPEERARFIL